VSGEPHRDAEAVLHHHGVPHRRQLIVGDGREWARRSATAAGRSGADPLFLAIIDGLELLISQPRGARLVSRPGVLA